MLTRIQGSVNHECVSVKLVGYFADYEMNDGHY